MELLLEGDVHTPGTVLQCVLALYRQNLLGLPMAPSYDRPPVIEAICEIRFAQKLESGPIEKIRDHLEKTYPVCEEGRILNTHIDNAEQKISTGTFFDSYTLSSDDGTECVLLMQNALSTVRMPPYEGWDIFEKSIHRNWKVFKKTTGYQEIVRIGLRFINRIDIPHNDTGLVKGSDFINLGLKVPGEIKGLRAYKLSFQAALGDDVYYNVISGPVNSPVIDHSGLRLDIDVYKDMNLPKNEKAVMALLRDFRQKKNDLFESLITNKARNLFNRSL